MNRPGLGIATCFDYTVPLETQIPLISRAGFTHISLGNDHAHSGLLEQSRREYLKFLLGLYGLKITSVHGISLCYPDSAERTKAILYGASDLHVPVVVAHPIPFDIGTANFDETLTRIVRCMKELEPLLRETGMRITLENVLPGPSTDLAVRALEQADPAYFGFCYDSAHEQVDGPLPFTLLKIMKDRIFELHLSDRIKEFVDHVPPGEGFIDWPEMASLLAETSFEGPLLFEVMIEHTSVKETKPFLELVYERAVWVDSMVKDCRADLS